MNKSIADLRNKYLSQTLLENDVAAEPMAQFQKRWNQVLASEIVEPNSMTLATSSGDGFLSAQIALLKVRRNRLYLLYQLLKECIAKK